MGFNFNIYSDILLVGGLTTIIISFLIFRRLGGAVRSFAYIMVANAVWALAYSMELASFTLRQMEFWIYFEYLGIATLPALWLIFIIKFIGREKWLTISNLVIILAIPCLTLLLLLTNKWHHLHYISVSVDNSTDFPTLAIVPGPWYHLFTVYFYLLLAGGVFLLISNYRKIILYRKQKFVILIAVLIPWICNIAYLLGLRPLKHIDITPFAFILTTFIIGVGLLRFKLFDIVPLAREKVMEALQEGVLVLDSRNRVIDSNHSIHKILSLNDREIIGKVINELFPNDNQLMQLIAQKVNGKLEMTLLNNKGASRIYEVVLTFLKEQVKMYEGTILLFRDITDYKQSELALRNAKEEAEQAAHAKSQFLSTMSHEIRTPMNAVIGFTHLLLKNNPRSDQKDYLDTLKFSGENLLNIINNILDYSKIEAGKLLLEEIDFNVKELVKNIHQSFQQKALEKNIAFDLNLDEAIPENLSGDPIRINQILSNLISNSIKFTSSGHVVIQVDVFDRDAKTTALHFAIKDSGIGIAEENLDKIFDSFSQANEDTTRNFGGTGLGLAITKRLLELLNSNIKVESTLNVGSEFSFIIVFRNASRIKTVNKAPAEHTRHSKVSVKKDLKGLRILVAEDNPVNVMLIKQLLKKWEAEFHIAENGLVALESVKTNDFDLILMDLQMPEMDGFTAAEEVRKLPGIKYQALPIIALTASVTANTKNKVYNCGMNNYISKPFNPDELYEKIMFYFNN